jgi:chromosome segregation ATPase
MAMRTNSSAKKTCSKCDKGAGAFSCDGCQQSYCLKHVAEHRQELVSQLDGIEQEHDLFYEDLSNRMQTQSEHILFSRINQWEKDSINRIEKAAEESRNALKQTLDSVVDHGQKSLNQISLKLRRARELDDFFENDLARWTQQLTCLRADIDYMSNSIDLANDNSISVIKFVKIIPDRLPDTSVKIIRLVFIYS